MHDPDDITVLIIDDDLAVLELVSKFMEKSGFMTLKADGFGDAHKYLDDGNYDILISDIMMAGKDGIEVLRYSHERWIDKPVILMTGYAQLKFAIDAIKNGAFDFVQKPIDFDYLKRVVWKASEYVRLKTLERNYTLELEAEVARRREELKKAILELEKTRGELLSMAQEKTSFISTVSHEMRTPLNGIVGAVDLLKETALEGKQAQYVALAENGVERLTALVEEILTFNYGKDSEDEVLSDFVDLREQVSALYSKMKPKFSSKGLTLSQYVDPAIDREILTDCEKVCRIIEIYLENALKFTEKGGVIIDLSSVGEYEDKRVRIKISDTGVGVPAGLEEKIFEPFFQAENYLTRKHEGAGLGLSIARQNAILIDGKVWCEREESGGSKFFLEIPVFMRQVSVSDKGKAGA